MASATTVRNHIRAAANKVASVQTKQATATDGSDERKQFAAALEATEQARLKQFAATDGRTEADVYLAFACRPLQESAVCVETDTAPLMCATHIVGLDRRNEPDPVSGQIPLCVPLYARADSEWRALVPNFDGWLFSSSRYPLLSADRRSVRPQYYDPKQITRLDELEVYFAVLTGTLQQAFATGEEETMRMFWRVLESFQNLVELRRAKYCGVNAGDVEPPVPTMTTEQLAKTILQRNESQDAALAYKRCLQRLSPLEFYEHMFRMMLECPEALHTSHLTRVESLLFALLLVQQLAGAEEPKVALGGVEDSIARMTLERAMRRIPKAVDVTQFTDKDELIRALHVVAEPEMRGSLRYFAFVVGVARLLLDRRYSMNELCARMQPVRQAAQSLTGLLAPCVFMAPSSEAYLSDASLAEFVLAVSKAPGTTRHAVLHGAMLVSASGTPTIDSVIRTNIARIKEVQEATISGTAMFCGQQNSFAFKRYLCVAARNNEKPAAIVEAILYASRRGVLGERRARTIVVRSAPQDSELFRLFSAGYGLQLAHLLATKPAAKTAFGRFFADFNVSHRALLKAAAQMPTAPVVTAAAAAAAPAAAEFEPFELARERVVRTVRAMTAALSGVAQECPICLLEFEPKQNALKPLHGDARHSVCVHCLPSIRSCPFCRRKLS